MSLFRCQWCGDDMFFIVVADTYADARRKWWADREAAGAAPLLLQDAKEHGLSLEEMLEVQALPACTNGVFYGDVV